LKNKHLKADGRLNVEVHPTPQIT